jgi:ferredoxin
MKKVVIDRRRCVGAGTCIFIAPTVFRWREGDLLKPELVDPTTVEEDVLREAAAVCPTNAILLEEAEEVST